MTIYKIMSEWINFYRIGRAFQFSYLEDLKKDKSIDKSLTVGFSGIRTWIIGIEGEHADHLTTTTTAQVRRLHTITPILGNP